MDSLAATVPAYEVDLVTSAHQGPADLLDANIPGVLVIPDLADPQLSSTPLDSSRICSTIRFSEKRSLTICASINPTLARAPRVLLSAMGL